MSFKYLLEFLFEICTKRAEELTEEEKRRLMNNYFLANRTVLLLVLVMLPALTLAQSGNENEVEITNSDIIIFCKNHEGGYIKDAREYGKKLFGSLEKFYENYHRIQCPPHFPSPLYMSVSKHPFDIEIEPEIEYISNLSFENRNKILNRPSKGFFKQTVLGVVIRNLKISQEDVNTEAIARYKDLKKALTEAGAKRVSELTEEEKKAFNE